MVDGRAELQEGAAGSIANAWGLRCMCQTVVSSSAREPEPGKSKRDEERMRNGQSRSHAANHSTGSHRGVTLDGGV